MQKLTKKLNIFTFVAILFMVFTISFLVPEIKANACTDCVRNVEISCYAEDTDLKVNESVTWRAIASYGTGYYKYSWSGTDGLSGSNSSVSKSYSSAGNKTARVAVTSGGKTFYKDCGSTVVRACGDDCVRNVEISCYAEDTNVNVNESVTWRAIASYGTGYYTYSWSGTNGLSGSNSSVSKSYSSLGTKTARVAVTSGGKTFYKDCGSAVVEEEEDENLTGSCDVDDSNVNVDESVTWSADASGGTGSYTYEWHGSSPLSGRTGRRVDVDYSSEGTKTGSVTIRSGNQSITRSCGTVYVEDDEDEDLDISCTVNTTNISVGQTVRFDVDADGGDGRYRYYWSGTEGVSGNNSSISKRFNTIGSKYVTVRVTSDGQSESVSCPTVVVGGYVLPPPASPASLSSVYLNQVPYTGVEDNPQFWAFIIGLFMFSGLAAYMIVSRKAKTERKNKILDFKNENMAKRGIK